MEKDPSMYEIAYLLSPFVPEEKLDDAISELRTEIESGRGLIVNEQRANMRRLAYAIKKPRTGSFDSAYFGWFRAMVLPEAAAEIGTKIGKRGNVIRSLITKIEKEEVARRAPKKFLEKKPLPVIAEKPKEEIKTEEFDKKLEELIGT